ncbi:MAG: cation transporter [bacterium]|nr:cation transporter [bacterium]
MINDEGTISILTMTLRDPSSSGIFAPQFSALVAVRRAAWVGLVCDVLLTLFKLAGGILGNSRALVADAVHSLTDVSTDVAVLFGSHYWSAPADEKHPHGHRRIETLITVIIGVALAAAGLGIGWDATHRLMLRTTTLPTGLALVAALVAIAVKEFLYRWTLAVGQRADSPATIANAWHHRSDALSSIPAALAVAVTLFRPSWAFVDRVGALAVCLFILHAAWRILRPALAQLIDEGAPMEKRRRLEELAVGVDGVLSAHALRTRYSGPKLHVDVHIEVDPELKISDGYFIAESVRRTLLAEDSEVAEVLVQLEPAALDSGQKSSR